MTKRYRLDPQRCLRHHDDKPDFYSHLNIVEAHFPRLQHNAKILVVLRYGFGWAIRKIALECRISTRQVIKGLHHFKQYDNHMSLPKVKHESETRL